MSDGPSISASGLPPGYGVAVAMNGLGQELWRYLICERCGALVPTEDRYISLHNRFHGVSDAD